MKFSYNLLKQFVKINKSAEDLGKILTEHAFEIEDVAESGAGMDGIVAAKVLLVEKHPNADRLRVAKLDVGGKEIYPVVCGAFNFEANDVVVLALPGAQIAQNIHSENHEPFVLQKATIRGIESQGMICAEFELGLTKEPGDKPEIMLLPKNTEAGTPLAKVLNKKPSDYILNAALPANRSDLFSHLGLSREIAAVLNQKIPTINYKLPNNLKPSKKWKVIVKNKAACPAYYAVKMKVEVGPSPKFMADFLVGVGMRPINNVVDITNFVMMELGNPTHAFNAKQVKGNIIVQNSRNGEKFTALNHKEYTLQQDTLMICDEQKNLAIGAIIGGKESEVSNDTQEIILEVANFNGSNVRNTSKKLGLRTESSAMWEKGVHVKLAQMTLARAIELLQKYAGGEILEFAKSEIAVKNNAAIKFTADEINKLLGTTLNVQEIVKYLSRFGIISKVLNIKLKTINATPPWWRTDITSMPDLAEEVLKLYGYNQIKPQALTIHSTTPITKGLLNVTDNVYKTKSFFAGLGYSEVQNYNFVSESEIKKFGETRPHIEIANPLSEDQRFLKRHLLIPLLKNVALNQHKFSSFKLFEVGKQYLDFEHEPLILTSIHFSQKEKLELLLMECKGNVLEFLKNLGCINVEFKVTDKPWVEIICDGKILGLLGTVQANILHNFGIKGNLVFAKLELEKIFELKKDVIFQPLAKFPEIQRDISIVLDSKVLWQDIKEVVNQFIDPLKAATHPNYTATLSLFEAPFLTADKDSQKFHQELAKQGKKNLGIRLIFKPKSATLTDAEITGILEQIMLKLKGELNAVIR